MKISDIKLQLTQVQYGLLIALSQSIPRVLVGVPEGNGRAQSTALTSSAARAPQSAITDEPVDLEPELHTERTHSWTTLDLVVTVETVKLRLYDEKATAEDNIKDHGIARFSLNNSTLRFKMLSDGAEEAQVVLKSFTMSNTRPGNSKFREIIPAAQHDRNQFMILYTMSGSPDNTSLAILTVDSPNIILAIEPVIALLNFFTSTLTSQEPSKSEPDNIAQVETSQPQRSRLDFRVDLHDVLVSILENDADPDSQTIRLSINQILLSQQVSSYVLPSRVRY